MGHLAGWLAGSSPRSLGDYKTRELPYPVPPTRSRQTDTNMTITPIPTTQLAAVSRSKETGTVVETIPVVQPEDLKPGQALVRIRYSGVCHVSCLLLLLTCLLRAT